MLSWLHATLWKPGAARKAAAARHRAAEKGMEPVGRGRQDRLFGQFGVLMARGGPQAGRSRVEGQAGTRQTFEVDSMAETGVGSDSRDGSLALWLFHGPVDDTPSGGGDRKAVRDRLPPQSSVANPERLGLELPEAPDSGAGKGRRGHRALEAVPVAPYKKRPKNLAPIWPSSMRAASCWFPTLPEHGRPGDTLPSCVVLGTGPRFRRSQPSAFPQEDGAWPSTPDSIATKTSVPLKWSNSSGSCSNICAVPWSCSGIAADLIREPW